MLLRRIIYFCSATILLSISWISAATASTDTTKYLQFDAPSYNASAVTAHQFDIWSRMAVEQPVSGAIAERRAGDLHAEWQAPNGDNVQLLVRQPNLGKSEQTYTIEPISDNMDASPIFDKALAYVRTRGIHRLLIKPGEYHFRTLPDGRSHWSIKNIRDVEISGVGAKMVFHRDAMGIWLEQSQRTKILGLEFLYALRTSSLGTIRIVNGKRTLAIDSAYPVTADDKIAQLQEIDPKSKIFRPGGARLVVLPNMAASITWAGGQNYQSALFDKFHLSVNASYAVLHQYYGGVPIRIDGQRGEGQTEDITLERVRITSSPGMGITVRGVRRGFALVDSVIEPELGGKNYLSSNWDGIHVLQIGGDLLIRGNHFSGMMDDAINVAATPVHPIEQIQFTQRRLLLSNYSRFISVGDLLAFFDPDGQYSGTARARTITAQSTDNSRQLVEVDALPHGINEAYTIRNVTTSLSRFLVADNEIARCGCHAILAQAANGLIADNKVKSINRNAIRILSSLSTWKEGAGGFNIAVRNNNIDDTGYDDAMDIPWGVVSIYGEIGGRLANGPINRWIEVSGNSITQARQGCLTVVNTEDAVLRKNSCTFAPEQSSQFVTRVSPRTKLNNIRSRGIRSE